MRNANQDGTIPTAAELSLRDLAARQAVCAALILGIVAIAARIAMVW